MTSTPFNMNPGHHAMGIALAGGLSSRMGTKKAYLRDPSRGYRTLLEITVDLLAQVPCTAVFVSGVEPGFPSFADRWPMLGPLGGIDAALHEVCEDQSSALLVPVDMPLLRADDLQELLTSLSATVPAVHARGWPLPLALRVNPPVRQAMAACLQQPCADGRSVRAFVAAIGGVSINPKNPDRFVSMDTPEAWAGYQDTAR